MKYETVRDGAQHLLVSALAFIVKLAKTVGFIVIGTLIAVASLTALMVLVGIASVAALGLIGCGTIASLVIAPFAAAGRGMMKATDVFDKNGNFGFAGVLAFFEHTFGFYVVLMVGIAIAAPIAAVLVTLVTAIIEIALATYAILALPYIAVRVIFFRHVYTEGYFAHILGTLD